MSIFPKLTQFIKGKLIVSILSGNKIGNKHISNSAEHPQKNVSLSNYDSKILQLLAEGAHGVPALDEQGIVIQVNLYGHPDVDTIDPVADTTLNAFRKLLRYGLVSESFETGKREYLITDNGRNRINL